MPVVQLARRVLRFDRRLSLDEMATEFVGILADMRKLNLDPLCHPFSRFCILQMKISAHTDCENLETCRRITMEMADL
jgi:hypothetical protein